MRLPILPILLTAALLPAQAPAKSDPPATKKTTAKVAVKTTPEAEAARQTLRQVLDAVDAGWFGQLYQGVSSVEMQGTLGIALSAAAVNQKVDSLSQGMVKGNSQGGQASLRVKGTYFANGDFKTDLAGDFGTLLYTRRGNRGFLYSKEQNAYTTAWICHPPMRRPLTCPGSGRP